ncbi:MAG: glycoside hydrolase family 57 protein, partial [Chitinophagaceae bacterium]
MKQKSICFYFQVHQPYRLRRYRFFDLGHNHHYFDMPANESSMKKIARNCYLPMNALLLSLIKQYKGKFKIAFSITGVALEQFIEYAPEVMDSFRELADTGCVEFLSETYAHSLVALKDTEEFKKQVQMHSKLIEQYFDQKTTIFRNTELIYSNAIGDQIQAMGYKGMIIEGAKSILAWRSPNFVYNHIHHPKFKLLLKNVTLSDDIAVRFSNKNWTSWPLNTEKYVSWLNALNPKEESINLFMDYETFGEYQPQDSGVFEFIKHLPNQVFKCSKLQFAFPSEIIDQAVSFGPIDAKYPISWVDEERDISAWLGNSMQDEAFEKLYSLAKDITNITDNEIQKNWIKLQSSDHFYYMCTKYFSVGDIHKYFNPYGSPFDAYINYMNVLSDFI